MEDMELAAARGLAMVLHVERKPAIADTIEKLLAEVDRLRSELAAATNEAASLRMEVREWLCVKCNMVFPGPPQEGLWSVVCPICGGDTMPKGRAELDRLRQELQAAQAREGAMREIVMFARHLITVIDRPLTEYQPGPSVEQAHLKTFEFTTALLGLKQALTAGEGGAE